MSSRSGNKGIVSSIVQGCDMPYTEDGIYVEFDSKPLIASHHEWP